MRAEHKPVAEGGKPDEPAASEHTPQSRGRVGSTSSIIRKLMEKVVKPKQPQTIHSGKISEEERHSTLAPFAMPSISIGQVNRDYEAFFKSAWGTAPSSSSSKTSAATPSSSALDQQHPRHAQAERDHKDRPSRRERKTDQPTRSPRPANFAGGRLRALTAEDDLSDIRPSSRSPPRSPQLRKAKQLNAPEVRGTLASVCVILGICTKRKIIFILQ